MPQRSLRAFYWGRTYPGKKGRSVGMAYGPIPLALFFVYLFYALKFTLKKNFFNGSTGKCLTANFPESAKNPDL